MRERDGTPGEPSDHYQTPRKSAEVPQNAAQRCAYMCPKALHVQSSMENLFCNIVSLIGRSASNSQTSFQKHVSVGGAGCNVKLSEHAAEDEEFQDSLVTQR